MKSKGPLLFLWSLSPDEKKPVQKGQQKEAWPLFSLPSSLLGEKKKKHSSGETSQGQSSSTVGVMVTPLLICPHPIRLKDRKGKEPTTEIKMTFKHLCLQNNSFVNMAAKIAQFYSSFSKKLWYVVLTFCWNYRNKCITISEMWMKVKNLSKKTPHFRYCGKNLLYAEWILVPALNCSTNRLAQTVRQLLVHLPPVFFHTSTQGDLLSNLCAHRVGEDDLG